MSTYGKIIRNRLGSMFYNARLGSMFEGTRELISLNFLIFHQGLRDKKNQKLCDHFPIFKPFGNKDTSLRFE